MRKLYLIFSVVVVLLVIPVQATRKGRPVHLGRIDYHVGKTIRERSLMRAMVSLYQENRLLHVNSQEGLLLTIVFKDEEGHEISQVLTFDAEDDVEIPSGASIVTVSYNDVTLVGMLY